MRTLLLLLFFPPLLFAQSTVVFADRQTSEPIADVEVFNSKGKLLGVSNQNGVVRSTERDKVIIRHFSYRSQTLKLNADTVFMDFTSTELDEFVVRSMTNEDLYKVILRKTRQKLPTGSYKARVVCAGSMHYVFENQHDTAIVNLSGVFDLIALSNKKGTKTEYFFFPVESFQKNVYRFKDEKSNQIFIEKDDKSMVKFYLGGLKNMLTAADLRSGFYGDQKYSDFSKSKRFMDSIPHLQFGFKKGRDENFKSVYYLKQDTILRQFSRSTSSTKADPKPDDNLYFDFLRHGKATASYQEVDGRYFYDQVTTDITGIMQVSGGVLYTMASAMAMKVVSIEPFSGEVNEESSVNPYNYMFDLPETKEQVAVLLVPSFKK